MSKSKLWSTFTTMLKIGFIGFGGGTALIPVIEDEVVNRSGLVTEEEFNSDVMIATITPGALPVEIATGIGHETAGNKGMVAGAAAMAFPGAFLTLLLLLVVSGAGGFLKTQIAYLAVGISAFIIYTLFLYAFGTLAQAKNRREAALYLFILLAVFFLSGEKNLYQLFGLSLTPVFGLSTIQVLGAAFFVILSTGGELRNVKKTVPALLIAAVYFFCVGGAHVVPVGAKPFLVAGMAVLAVLGMALSVAKTPHKRAFPMRKLLRAVLAWAIFLLVFSLPALLRSPDTLRFIGTGFLSSVMSFGGGDAYLTVAQGLFVDTGQVGYADFYGNIVSVANALPGSILCKILTGVGYVIGYERDSGVLGGVIMAVCGFACSVTASGIIYELVRAVYEKYENLRIFAVVKHFIRPIISGLLLNVAVSLYLSGIAAQAQGGLTAAALAGIALLVIAGNFILGKRKNVHLIWKILLSAGISFVGCNLL